MFITRLSLFAAVLLILASSVFSQSSTAGIKWERYRASGVSVMFPKLPTLVETSNVCSEIEKREYYAYADEIVYQLIVASKSATRPPDWCDRRFRFDEKLLDARLTELQNQKIGDGRNMVQRSGQMTFISNSFSVRRIISDMENDRWIELAVYARGSRDPDQKRFLDSIDLKDSEGRKVGSGAEATIGDPAADLAPVPVQNSPADKSAEQQPGSEPFMIISKPRARYTESARQANTQGSVLVKVTLLANGGTGEVTPVKELSHGLTEQAIAAARRIVFLPKKVNGVPVSVVQTSEYTFSIY